MLFIMSMYFTGQAATVAVMSYSGYDIEVEYFDEYLTVDSVLAF